MGCKTPWTVDKLWDEFPRTFIEKELRQHKERIIMEREKARLPETQNEIFEEKQHALYTALTTAYTAMYPNANKAELATVREMIRAVRARLGVDDTEHVVRIAPDKAKAKKVGNFQAVCPCPSGDCRGFIQKRSYTCGICNVSVCSKCRVEKSEEHECKEDDIATVEALLKDTKPCPSCGTPIFKIDGCDQIWTPCCKKAFSWRTGEFETKIHSPEYYDYCRRMGIAIPRAQDAEQAACNNRGLWAIGVFMRAFEAKKISPKQVELFISKYRSILHNQLAGQDIYKELRPPIDDDGTYANLRRGYILRNITEEDWKKRLIMEERKRERRAALSNIFGVLLQVSVDLLNEIEIHCSPSVIDKNLAALDNLKSYINECFLGVSRRYKTIPYMVDENFRITRATPKKEPQKKKDSP